ncbi:MAG: sigma-70 family RNA polymerase sigma factor [Pirellulales bacterium]
MNDNYLIPQMRELRDQQVRCASPMAQIEQSQRAEKLLAELEPTLTYAFGYLFERIIGHRPESAANVKVSGEDARHDLRLFVEDVSDAADVDAALAGQRVLTTEELSHMFNVSTKTISRWREHGLVSRRFVFDGRKRVGYLQSSVESFVHQNEDRVRRGANFSQMTREQRDQIINGARQLARSGSGAADIARELAERTGRSIETIRYTLKNFDQQHPDLAIFPDSSGPLSVETKRIIYQQYRRGTSVEELVKRHRRTKTSIYRALAEMRAERILELPLDFIPNDDFKRVKNDRKFLAATPEGPQAKRVKRPAGLPPYLASLYEIPLLTAEQERHLFRKFNYLKYKASKLREQLDPASPKSPLMDDIEALYDDAVQTKNEIVGANLRLVVSIAKRHVAHAENFFELVSDGNMSLIRAAEKFDYARGNKFSTYASWAIMKNFARSIPGELKLRDRFRTSQDEAFQAAPEVRSDPFEQEHAQARRQVQVNRILRALDDREQQIIMSRYGLNRGDEPHTLKEVGAELGVTKERIRQIEARALSKLRRAAQVEKIELPAEW